MYGSLVFAVKLFLCESLQSSIRDAVEMGELQISSALFPCAVKIPYN